MKTNTSHKWLLLVLVIVLPCCLGADGCDRKPTSDDVQRDKQEKLLKEMVAQVGMPNIKNFREAKMLREVIELRDQASLTTYTYLENVVPKVVVGHTCCGGKLTFLRESISYGIPASTQFTNPQKIEASYSQGGFAILPQADPNGLFSASSAEGTWIMMYDEKAGKAMPQYAEPRILVFTFKLPLDTAEDLKASGGVSDSLAGK